MESASRYTFVVPIRSANEGNELESKSAGGGVIDNSRSIFSDEVEEAAPKAITWNFEYV